jgi:hypothetical protein
MTKKHFKLIAEILSEIKDPKEKRELAEHNAKVLASKYPRFDKEKFLTACGCK